MSTYNIYRISFTDKKPNELISDEELYNIVTQKGEWEVVDTYNDKESAIYAWKHKWQYEPYTKTEDDLMYCNMYMIKSPKEKEEIDYVLQELLI